ncbi:MAG: PKD domain-containing protein [Chitinophagaceae bacterium]|nr:PKD domain-containing protein [Chitinophagaceae bacterium]
MFTNTTVPLGATDSIRWTFGDGTSSNVVHPNHTYTQPGTYTVCLRVQKRNNAGTPINCVREICHTIVIATPPPACNLVVNYSWHADSLNNRKIYFTNLTNTTSASAIVTWTFGDGTAANTWNAIHEYAQPGRYLVCLKVQTSNTCVRMICDSIVVGATPPPPCNNQSNFDFIRSTANSQTFAFFPAYQSNAAQYTWTFGDGTGSTSMLTNHTYAQAGMYNVCLTVWRNANCASTTCRTVQAGPTNNCDTAHVNYTFTRDVVMPNKVFFTAHSTMALIDQTWTITRVSNNQTIILHQNNPMYIFADTGYYRVCLRAVTVGGCVKEYCNYIRIEQIAPPNACVLQPYPNPATAMVNVNVNLSVPETITAKVYNTLNILVAERQIAGVAGNNVVSINIGTLPLGAYIIRVTHGNAVCYGTFQKM